MNPRPRSGDDADEVALMAALVATVVVWLVIDALLVYTFFWWAMSR